MYITLAQLAERPGATELAQVASDENSDIVDAALMDTALRGGDVSAWSADEVALANDAVARINDAITDADGLIDGFLGKRGYTLPLTPIPPLVAGWARAITRYNLHKDRMTEANNDPIYRAYADATKFLQMVAQGNFSLGAGDSVVVVGVGSPATIRDRTPRPGPWCAPEIY